MFGPIPIGLEELLNLDQLLHPVRKLRYLQQRYRRLDSSR